MEYNGDAKQRLVVNHIEEENYAYATKEYNNDDANDFDDDNIDDGFSTPRGQNDVEINKISKPKYNIRSNFKNAREQEAVATLLSTFGEDIERTAENFIKQNIQFKDLATLTREDFELLGIVNKKQQDELLNTLTDLPKQTPDYKKEIISENTKNYNNEILSSASNHLKTMNTAISATNLKLKVVPTEDYIVDEEEFASTYILQTLDELRRVVDEIDDRIAVLEDIAEEKSKEKNLFNKVCIASGITVISLIYYLWRKNF